MQIRSLTKVVVQNVTLLLLVAGVPASNSTAGSQVADFDLQKIEASVRRANLIFVGTVTDIGAAPPPIKPGIIVVTQSVTYRVDQILRGTVNREVITVNHRVVAGSRNAPDKRLSPNVFARGRQLIVLCFQSFGQIVDLDSNFGTLEASPSNIQLVRKMIASQP